jgi:AcrR family transcriptional regulator
MSRTQTPGGVHLSGAHLSDRMLIYHFGSKEGLLVEVIEWSSSVSVRRSLARPPLSDGIENTTWGPAQRTHSLPMDTHWLWPSQQCMDTSMDSLAPVSEPMPIGIRGFGHRLHAAISATQPPFRAHGVPRSRRADRSVWRNNGVPLVHWNVEFSVLSVRTLMR